MRMDLDSARKLSAEVSALVAKELTHQYPELSEEITKKTAAEAGTIVIKVIATMLVEQEQPQQKTA